MSIAWNFNADDYKEKRLCPDTRGRSQSSHCERREKKSQNKNDMLVLTLDVSGHSGSLWFYLVFMPNNPQITKSAPRTDIRLVWYSARQYELYLLARQGWWSESKARTVQR